MTQEQKAKVSKEIEAVLKANKMPVDIGISFAILSMLKDVSYRMQTQGDKQ